MGRKYVVPKIADNPASKNLAYLFRHPDSGHPVPHNTPEGFKLEIQELHEEIKRLYPQENTSKIIPKTIEFYIAGERNPTIDALGKIVAAHKSLKGIEIDPYDLFVDKSKWQNLAQFSPIKRKIIENLPQVKNTQILKGILALTETNIPNEKNKVNSHFVENSLKNVE